MLPAVPVPRFTIDELSQAVRNHGMPMESLRYDITPVGLHYLLIHYDIPLLEPDEWQISIAGAVDLAYSISLDELQNLPAVTMPLTMECAGNGRIYFDPPIARQPWFNNAVGNAEWTGTSLWPLLEKAGLRKDAVEILFSGADHGIDNGIERTYRRSLSIAEVQRPEVILAYEMNGQPLLPQHGSPVRLVVPGWYGMASVKWLTAIEALTEPSDHYMMKEAYVVRSDSRDLGRPTTRMLARSLMIPPGIAESHTRERITDAGPQTITGRAWCGSAPIVRVEFSADDGATWIDTDLEPSESMYSWSTWTAQWNPLEPGDHYLRSRATAADGQAQPFRASWNIGGYENNSIERVHIVVR